MASAVERATGRDQEAWNRHIAGLDVAESGHQRIVSYLYENEQLSYWWAQEITVAYEKSIGRRVTGQTQDGRFQLGVTRTIPVSSRRLWSLLTSSAFVARLLRDKEGSEEGSWTDAQDERLASLDLDREDAISAHTTTFASGSHVRMRWTDPAWDDHSILQIRVTERSPDRSSVTFHQERLPSLASRDRLKERWRRVADDLVAASETGR